MRNDKTKVIINKILFIENFILDNYLIQLFYI